jgi:hypothetical protein
VPIKRVAHGAFAGRSHQWRTLDGLLEKVWRDVSKLICMPKFESPRPGSRSTWKAFANKIHTAPGIVSIELKVADAAAALSAHTIAMLGKENETAVRRARFVAQRLAGHGRRRSVRSRMSPLPWLRRNARSARAVAASPDRRPGLVVHPGTSSAWSDCEATMMSRIGREASTSGNTREIEADVLLQINTAATFGLNLPTSRTCRPRLPP